jgi:hypothetical protein
METYATFNKGDKVTATMNTPHLTAGDTYTIFKIIGLNREPYARVYWVADNNKNLMPIKNAHLLLELGNA